VTVVEFFDYRCGYCKRVASVLKEIMAGDPNLRVVFKELPILSQESNLLPRLPSPLRRRESTCRSTKPLIHMKNVSDEVALEEFMESSLHSGVLRVRRICNERSSD